MKFASKKIYLLLILLLTIGAIYLLSDTLTKAAGTFDNPHGNYTPNTEMCGKCHSGHSSETTIILRLTTQRQTCYACHGYGGGATNVQAQFGETVIGTSVYSPFGSFHPVPSSIQVCTNCHNPHLKNEASPGGTASLLSVGPSKINWGNAVCGYCHGVGSTAPGGNILTPFTGTPHDVSLANPDSGTQIKCARCHQPHGSSYDALVRSSVYDQAEGVWRQVSGNDKTLCFACHINEYGTYGGKDIYTQVYHGIKTTSTVALTVYPGIGYDSSKATACLNCHEPHGKTGITDYKRISGNDLCVKCHDDGSVAGTVYSYKGVSVYNSSGHVAATVYTQSIPAGSCLLCHAVHGKNDGTGIPFPKQLRLAQENVCFGGVSGACHDNSSNSARGINIKSRFTAGSNASAHHSISTVEQSVYGTRLQCVNCHDPHLNNASSKVVDPSNRFLPYTLTQGFNNYISDTGVIYLMVKARHDGIPPTVNAASITISNMTATTCQIDWTTSKYSNCIVEYGPDTNYGSSASATGMNADYTQHRITLTGLTQGQNYHFRIKATDRIGNYSYSADQVLDSTVPVITVAPSLGSGTGSTLNINWTTNEQSTSYVDFNTVAAYPVDGYVYHPGNNSLVTSHTVTLTGLTLDVDYQYQVRSTDARGNTVTSGTFTFRMTAPPPTPNIIYEPDILNYAPDASVTLECYGVTDPNPPTQYYFEVSTASNFSSISYTSGWINNPSYPLTVSNYYAVTYYWRVKARNTYLIESGWSDWSGAIDNHFVHDGGLEPKIDSCPFIYVWNGTKYEYVSDMSGPVINLPKHIKVDANKRIPYYLPTANLIPDKNNQYLVKIRSTAPGEIDILDQVGLVLVDHPAGYEIISSSAEATGQFMKEKSPRKFYTVSKNALTVKKAVDRYGRDVTKELLALDNIPAPSETKNFALASSYLLDFGKLAHPEYAKLILDGWTNYRKEIKVKPKDVPRVEVINRNGQWETVRNIGFISGDKKTMVVDMSGAFKTGDHRVRIFIGERDRRVVLDRVRMDQSPPVTLKTTYVTASYANLHFRGPARQAGTTFDHPVLAEDDVKSGPINYIFYGKFTKYGDVRELLDKKDDMFVIMQHGDEVMVKFDNPPLQKGLERTPVLLADFYYKQTGRAKFDPTVKIPVDPLPFHKMTRYPYELPDKYPGDAAHKNYVKNWLTREYVLVDGKVVPAESIKKSLWSRFVGFFGDLWNQIIGFLKSVFIGDDTTDNTLTSESGDDRSFGLPGEPPDKHPGKQAAIPSEIKAQLVYTRQKPKIKHYSLNTNYVLLQSDTGTSVTQYNVNSAGAEIYQSSSAPTPSFPGNDASAEKSKVLIDDANRWTTDYYAPNSNDGSYNYQLFKFVISDPKSKLTGIRLNWKGYGEPTAGYNTTVSLWNFSTSTWDALYDTVIGSEVGLNLQKYVDYQPFCYKCHAGTVPSGVQLGPITRNISSSFPTDIHGGGASYDRAGTTIKAPYVRGNPALPCADCHDPHGSPNAYHLRENVNTQTWLSLPDMSVSGPTDTSKNAAILTYCQSCHNGTLDDFHADPCLNCHRTDSPDHGFYAPTASDFSRACTYCHYHGGNMPAHGNCHCNLNYVVKAF